MSEHKELYQWSKTLSTEQIDFLCDSGYYNNAIRGYLIKAAKNTELTEKQIKTLLLGLNWALDENSKEQAEAISNEY